MLRLIDSKMAFLILLSLSVCWCHAFFSSTSSQFTPHAFLCSSHEIMTMCPLLLLFLNLYVLIYTQGNSFLNLILKLSIFSYIPLFLIYFCPSLYRFLLLSYFFCNFYTTIISTLSFSSLYIHIPTSPHIYYLSLPTEF